MIKYYKNEVPMFPAMIRSHYPSVVKPLALIFSALLGASLLTGCGGSSSSADDLIPDTPGWSNGDNNGSDNDNGGDDNGADNGDTATDSQIRLNQLGFLPGGQKLAVVPDVEASSFSIVMADSGDEVYSGELSSAATWAPAQESVKLADFSSLSDAGEYRVRVEGVEDSHSFRVGADAYDALNIGALKAYYFNRASTELLEEHAGDYARPMGHPDDEVIIHSSAAHGSRSAGDIVSAPKGWYDAGDFGKYVVNSGISTYTLLAAYEHFPDYYSAQNVNIPESDSGRADILDEVLWNLVWMLDMQDLDGGVYHKLTTLGFAGAVMPHEATADRYMIGKATSATLNFAAVMATASRVYQPYDAELAEQMLTAAEDAWSWAEENDDISFSNPSDVNTGEYGGNDLNTNFAWAAAELYITTQESSYYDAFLERDIDIWVPGWTDSRGLAWMSLAHHRDDLPEATDIDRIELWIHNLAGDLADQHESSAYRVAMQSGDFFWGSNANVLNRAMMLLQGYRLDPEEARYRDAAQSLLDYILGRNPTGYSFVTGFGHQTPMDIHHRASYADDNEQPVPGFVAGGPNPHQQADDCGTSAYPSSVPAKAYLDDWCSYSTNEVTINWNAPLVYVSGALQVLGD